MTEDSTTEAFFEAKYLDAPDPWNFATSPYERSRYAAILSFLKQRRFARAFEPGCSVGVLTASLARICGQVEAMDISPTAVRVASERCRHQRNVTVRQGALPDAMPGGFFDLIIFSEIGYYFEPGTLSQLAILLTGRLVAGSGVLLGAHWLGRSDDHRISGDQVHEILGATAGLALSAAERFEGFRIGRWTRA